MTTTTATSPYPTHNRLPTSRHIAQTSTNQLRSHFNSPFNLSRLWISPSHLANPPSLPPRRILFLIMQRIPLQLDLISVRFNSNITHFDVLANGVIPPFVRCRRVKYAQTKDGSAWDGVVRDTVEIARWGNRGRVGRTVRHVDLEC